MDFYTRLTQLRKAKGVSQAEIINTLGFGRNAFTQWKHGAMPNSSSQKVLADYFGVSVDYLMGRTETPNVSTGNQIAAYISSEKRGMRPIVNIASVKNGGVVHQDIIGFAPVADKFDHDNFFWIQIVGGSMSPKVDDGDLVLIQDDAEIENGCLAIVLVDEEDGVLEQVYMDDEAITLHSINPYYPDRVFRKDEQSRLRFIGRVRKVNRDL